MSGDATSRLPKIAAFDLSLTQTGYAISHGGPTDVELGTICPTTTDGVERLRSIRNRVLELARGADLVLLEGYSYASANRAHQLGELGGVVRVALQEAGCPWLEVQPSSLKQLATGKGKATKEEVLVSAVKRLGYEGAISDEADARWLLEAALQHFNLAAASLPKTHLAALDKVRFPTLRGVRP